MFKPLTKHSVTAENFVCISMSTNVLLAPGASVIAHFVETPYDAPYDVMCVVSNGVGVGNESGISKKKEKRKSRRYT